MEQSIFSWGEHPANPLALQDSVKDLKIQEETSCLPILQSLNIYGLDTLSGKMFQGSCHLTEEKILVPSLGAWGNWGMGGLTESWTLNGAEHTGIHAPSRSAEGVSSLSDVLETQQVPQRFYLSQKACSGILRRAERRGKELPSMLRKALEAVAM
jgi:hypothetical protein